MSYKGKDELRTGLNTYQLRQLRGAVAFMQDFKCWGCDEPLSPHNGSSILHHLNGNPKDNRIVNLSVVCQLDHFDVHGWLTSEDRKLFERKKKPTKKELIEQRIKPLGDD